jgi:hypothetical protein
VAFLLLGKNFFLNESKKCKQKQQIQQQQCPVLQTYTEGKKAEFFGMVLE